MSLIINQTKVCVTWGWVYYVIQPMSIKFVVSLRLMSLGLSLTYICHWGLCEFGLFHWVLCHFKHDPYHRAYISWKFLLFKSNHLDLVLMLCFIAFTIVIGLQSLLKPLYQNMRMEVWKMVPSCCWFLHIPLLFLHFMCNSFKPISIIK